jgi:hypothetical protein
MVCIADVGNDRNTSSFDAQLGQQQLDGMMEEISDDEWEAEVLSSGLSE